MKSIHLTQKLKILFPSNIWKKKNKNRIEKINYRIRFKNTQYAKRKLQMLGIILISFFLIYYYLYNLDLNLADSKLLSLLFTLDFITIIILVTQYITVRRIYIKEEII